MFLALYLSYKTVRWVWGFLFGSMSEQRRYKQYLKEMEQIKKDHPKWDGNTLSEEDMRMFLSVGDQDANL